MLGAGVSGKIPKGASVAKGVTVAPGARTTGDGVSGKSEPEKKGDWVGLPVRKSNSRISAHVMHRPCFGGGGEGFIGKRGRGYSLSVNAAVLKPEVRGVLGMRGDVRRGVRSRAKAFLKREVLGGGGAGFT